MSSSVSSDNWQSFSELPSLKCHHRKQNCNPSLDSDNDSEDDTEANLAQQGDNAGEPQDGDDTVSLDLSRASFADTMYM